ncbi:autotransporter outer membrane beta-barrel domain-containing protein [Anaerovibrio lipolyticus]|uniref:autotransporter outer membrane beta-barrel domain-containing protein n=1 Tax=Anaerovibrio lipolyticus TaxID=82374 RepID=UPI0026EC4084|nr:autotransporter outer membrane beta-barrel domain-containing protein [Anaerovibrio lipolyticus]MBE6106637.1 autotransporter outer membrane beta-barrel domain-containing protein [Anaerovibrio lipolyticus]
METRKYNSPLGGDISTNKTNKGKGWKGIKGQAALALAVSLWIAGGSMASASLYIDATDNIVKGSVGSGTAVPNLGEAAADKTLTVTGNVLSVVEVYGGLVGGNSSSGEAKGYHLIINNAKVATAMGARSNHTSRNLVEGNFLKISNSSVGEVRGGSSKFGDAKNNQVELIDSTLGDVYGGHAYDGNKDATDNKVYITDSIVTGTVRGGFSGTETGDFVTGNKLYFSGVNSAGNVKNFQTIYITSAEWEKPALTLTGTGIAQNSDGSWATIDTRGITFTGVDALNAGQKTTLIKNKMTGFGGTILSGKYKVGTTLEGLGTASISDDDLIYTIDKGTKMEAQEQTHNTVMGAEVGMAALSAGNDFVGAATEGLSMAGNTGTDGMATYANMGGGSMNVETGSHVKTHTWNAILALGHKNEKKLSTTEYGAFFEYGTGNYSTFNGDERGDGSTRYTGGGILGKWQKNNGFYVEGSLRAGSIHDDAHNVLRDGAGNPYSYDTDATYWGAHIGVGREIKLNKTDILDLYAKYFYNHRGSVSFDAGGHYDLGAVESSVLRVGTRYTVKQNDNINYYGGLAVEHEFCGRASGFADGVAIRGADISGTSVRGEIGATFRPGEKSNVTLDLNLSGFAGKKQGLTGGLSAVFHI